VDTSTVKDRFQTLYKNKQLSFQFSSNEEDIFKCNFFFISDERLLFKNVRLYFSIHS